MMGWWRRKDDRVCKIVVYSQGVGGEVFAEMVEQKFPVMEIIKLESPEQKSTGRVRKQRRKIEEMIVPYIGKADLIVLASYDATVVALKYLRIKYPEQNFIGMSWPVIREDDTPAVILTSGLVRNSWAFARFRHRLPGQVVVKECVKFDKQEIKYLARQMRKMKPKNVVIGSLDLLARDEVWGEVCYGIRVLDGYKATLKNLCRVLKIKDTMRIR